MGFDELAAAAAEAGEAVRQQVAGIVDAIGRIASSAAVVDSSAEAADDELLAEPHPSDGEEEPTPRIGADLDRRPANCEPRAARRAAG